MDAIQRAGLEELLGKMPEGLNTMLNRDFSDQGVEISGGEAQKLAMARAIYKNAPFVILDEPTAALDPVAENEIYTRFHEIIGSKTALFISHRLSACRFSKEILVFENGNIIERGSHEELSEKPGLYRQMWQAPGPVLSVDAWKCGINKFRQSFEGAGKTRLHMQRQLATIKADLVTGLFREAFH